MKTVRGAAFLGALIAYPREINPGLQGETTPEGEQRNFMPITLGPYCRNGK